VHRERTAALERLAHMGGRFFLDKYFRPSYSTTSGVPFLYYPDPLFVTTQTVNMLLTVWQGGHHRPVVVKK
jgi:hypothetical protein